MRGGGFFSPQNSVTSNENIQVALSYVSINVRHSAKLTKKKKKRKTNSHTPHLCTPGSSSPVWALMDTPSSGQRADEGGALCAGPHSLS